MTARLIDGKAMAQAMRERLKAEIEGLKGQGVVPGLAVVLIGDDPASAVYVSNKEKAAAAVGMQGQTFRFPDTVSEQDVLQQIERLNKDVSIHGILVQMPLPQHLDSTRIIQAIAPHKDVDGLHLENIGRLAAGLPGLAPCTPQGCMALIQSTGQSLKGARAVILGRSQLVGRPLIQMLLNADCTVAVCHSRTVDPAAVTRTADILVAAVGKPRLVKGDWIKPGAVVIDVGINRLSDNTLAGDVDFAEAQDVAGYLTPVPGGVGPMTIAFLLSNTVRAARGQNALKLSVNNHNNFRKDALHL